MIAMAKGYASVAAAERPTAITAITPDGVRYVGDKKRFRMVITIIARGYCLNCLKWVDKILRRGKYICSECGGDKFVP